tara:strand:- start:34064 stop:34702 length:639 start_codon:yes stop_codon:yes gene_type:complete
MIFKEFLNNLNKIEKIKLGGLDAQFRLAPKIRLGYDAQKIRARKPKIAAVLALFYPNKNNKVSLLFTERASYNGTHSGQISFPGGKVEKSDLNLKETAIRETFEEVGVLRKNIRIVRKITEVYIPPSNFLVTPFIGITTLKPVFKINSEVAKIIEVPFHDLLDDNNLGTISIANRHMKERNVPCFNINGSVIWGATAMMLSEINEVLKNIKT